MYDFKNALVPHNHDGSVDQRYSKVVGDVIAKAGAETIKGLQDFYAATSDVEKQYGGYATQFVQAFYDTPMEGWQRKGLRNNLKPLLQEIGFKPSKVSKIIGSAELVSRLTSEGASTESTDWVKSLPVSSQYELSRMSDAGFNQAWANESKWGDQPVSHHQLEKLRQKHPAEPDNNRGKWNRSGSAAANSTQESINPPAPIQQPAAAEAITAPAVSVSNEAETIPTTATPVGEPEHMRVSQLQSAADTVEEIDDLLNTAGEPDPVKAVILDYFKSIDAVVSVLDQVADNPEYVKLFGDYVHKSRKIANATSIHRLTELLR